jgi:hypothetical protein
VRSLRPSRPSSLSPPYYCTFLSDIVFYRLLTSCPVPSYTLLSSCILHLNLCISSHPHFLHSSFPLPFSLICLDAHLLQKLNTSSFINTGKQFIHTFNESPFVTKQSSHILIVSTILYFYKIITYTNQLATLHRLHQSSFYLTYINCRL